MVVFPHPVGPVTSTMPKGLWIAFMKCSRARGLEPQLGQVEGQVRLVQDAEHDLLAEDGGKGADAQVDGPLHDADLDAPVLRHAPLGDVEIGHDLQAGDDGGLHAVGGAAIS